MTHTRHSLTRREFTARTLLTGTAALAMGSSAAGAALAHGQPGRIRTGVIGCGSVSHSYLPVLAASPHVELVSLCDIRPERAKRQAEKFGVPNHYSHIDQMLAGAPFDLFVDLTDMREHERLNRQALEAGRHVWSEEPLANSLREGQRLLELARTKRTRLSDHLGPGATTRTGPPDPPAVLKTLAPVGRTCPRHGRHHRGGCRPSRHLGRVPGSSPSVRVPSWWACAVWDR